MLIESLIKRVDGSKIDIEGESYHFAPNEHGAHVCDVLNKQHAQRFLGIPEGYAIYDAPEVTAKPDEKPAQQEAKTSTDEKPAETTAENPPADAGRDAVAAQYEAVIGKKPHHRTSIESMRKEIEEAQAKGE